MKVFKILSMALCSLLLACEPDDALPKATQSGADTAGAKVNGEVWVAATKPLFAYGSEYKASTNLLSPRYYMKETDPSTGREIITAEEPNIRYVDIRFNRKDNDKSGQIDNDKGIELFISAKDLKEGVKYSFGEGSETYARYAYNAGRSRKSGGVGYSYQEPIISHTAFAKVDISNKQYRTKKRWWLHHVYQNKTPNKS